VQRGYVIPRSSLGYRLDQAAAVRRYVAGDRDRWVLAETDSLALPLLSLKHRARLPNPVAYISVGLCDRVASGRMAPRLARRYLGLAELADAVFVYTPREAELLATWAPRVRVHVIPLGIDVAWWSPPEGTPVVGGSVLSAGRDSSRDFPTLADAARDLPGTTTIVGTLAGRQGVRSGARLTVRDDVPLAELRELVWRAQAVAVPSRRAAYGAGQTTALQAMAAARPVVMTDTGWAAHFGLRAGEHFVDVPPEDVAALRAALASLAGDAAACAALGGAARAAVRERFSSDHEAAAILRGLQGAAA
jgi:glycosyltransferase involved in cell wall biosynthesis